MEESIATRKPYQVELLVALEHFIDDVRIVVVVGFFFFFFFFSSWHVHRAVGSTPSIT
jgi:hypothetical protein